MKTKEAKGSALKEGLKKYVGNLTGGRVREAKKAREGFKKRTAKNTEDAYTWRNNLRSTGAVSYTHLTLPTSDLV